MALKRKPAARGTRAPRVPSIVDWFSQLPWLAFVAGSGAPDVCPLALAAARAPLEGIGEDGQSDSTHATIRDWPAAVAQVRRASAATPCRTVRFTLSINAVLS